MEEFILDELIRDYKYKCTRVGRFPILLSGSLIFSFSLASMLGWIIIFSNYLFSDTTSMAYIFYSIFLILLLIGYMVIADYYIFKVTKKQFMLECDNEKLLKVQCSKWKIFKTSWVEKEYINNEFLKCLDKYGLTNNEELLNKVIEIIYLKRKSKPHVNVINIALIGTISYPALKPLYDYLQCTLIPADSKIFNIYAVLEYGTSILVLVTGIMIVYMFISFLDKHLFYRREYKEKSCINSILRKLEKYRRGVL